MRPQNRRITGGYQEQMGSVLEHVGVNHSTRQQSGSKYIEGSKEMDLSRPVYIRDLNIAVMRGLIQ